LPVAGQNPPQKRKRFYPGPYLSQTFAALKYPNYRLWFFGQLVSLFGTWMQSTAQGFLVYELTNSPLYLGYVGFAAGLPSWLFTLYGGVIADRMSRRTLLIITQNTMMILAFVLAGLALTNLIQPWHIVFLAFLLGIANAFDAPARQAFVLEMVEREDLVNGPAFAGITYAIFGAAWCFIINGVTYIAVIVALLMMRLKPMNISLPRQSLIKDVKEGFQYVTGNAVILVIILNLGMVSLFGMGFITLMPAWAVTVLGGDATTNGYMQSARGLGALIGALMIASLSKFNIKGKLFTLGASIMPLGLIVFSYAQGVPMSLFLLVITGWGFMVMMNMSNALVQTNVPDELRGRVMGIYTLIFFGFMPIGALINGALAESIGEQATVIVNAIIMAIFTLIIWLKVPRLRAMD
jgi:MFS family permease